MHNHRVTCADCAWTRRENCADCARDTAARHRAETGHAVELRITQVETWHELQDMTGLAHRVLTLRGKRRGW